MINILIRLIHFNIFHQQDWISLWNFQNIFVSQKLIILQTIDFNILRNLKKKEKKEKNVNKIRRIFPPRGKPPYLKNPSPLPLPSPSFPSNAIRNIGT